jgi:aryl-alcohol dehydrogenase-like predicted oxidoreductase
MHREIGKTGLKITAIGLGAMPLSLSGRPSEEQAFAVIEAFIQSGGNFIDTANVYCVDDADLGHNERLIDKALRRIGKRDAVVIATKGGLRRPKGDWTVDGDPRWLRASCELSLKDLNTGVITLYQLHAVDPKVGLQASLAELMRLREEGKILHIGLSNVSPEDLETALTMTPIASVQNRCNPFYKKDFTNGLVELCQRKGIAYIPHSPVGGHFGHTRIASNPVFSGLAKQCGTSTYSLALAWLLHKGDHLLPIPGASRVESVLDSISAMDLLLQPEIIAAIDRFQDAF